MREYIRRIGTFPRDIKLFVLYALIVFIGTGVFTLIFNLYLVELGFREDFIGEWSAIQTISMAVSATTMGTVLNRFGPWRAATVGLSLITLVTLAMALITQREALLALAVLNGVATSFLWNPVMPFILRYSPAHQRAHIAAFAFSVISLSTMIGSLLGGIAPGVYASIAGVSDTSVSAYRAAMLLGTAAMGFGMIPLLKMDTARNFVPQPKQSAAEAGETPEQARQVRKDVFFFVLAGGLMSIGVGMVQPFYNVFLSTPEIGASDRQIGYIFALGGLVAAVVGLGAPWLSNRVGSLRAVLVLRLIVTPFYLLLIFVPGLGVAVMAYLSRQVSISMAWPIDSTFIGDVLPPRASSGVFGMRSAAWNAGFAVSSLAAGRLIVSNGYNITFVSLLFFSGLATIVFYAHFVRHPRIRAGEMPGALPASQRPGQTGTTETA